MEEIFCEIFVKVRWELDGGVGMNDNITILSQVRMAVGNEIGYLDASKL